MEEIRKIDFILTIDNGHEVIKTTLNGKKHCLDFTTDDQTNLRDLFNDCLIELETKPFIFAFFDDGSVKNDTIKNTAKLYIDDLNTELSNCLTEINDLDV